MNTSNIWQTNRQINQPDVIFSVCCDYLHVFILLWPLLKVLCHPVGFHCIKRQSFWVVLGCSGGTMKKQHPHWLWLSQQTHVCLTLSECRSSISRNLVLPFSLLFLFRYFQQWQAQTRKPTQASEMAVAEQHRDIILKAAQSSLWWMQAHCRPQPNCHYLHKNKTQRAQATISGCDQQRTGICRLFRGGSLINCIILWEFCFCS